MLYSYPEAATAENWLHECLMQTISNIHDRVDAKQNLPHWPAIIAEPYQEALRSRGKLKTLIAKYSSELKKLPSVNRQQIRDALSGQNQLDELFRAEADCEELSSLPQTLQQPAKDLCVYVFGLLTDFDVRKNQYQIVYDSSEDKVCPFCGIERFAAPPAPSEDLDHYLPKSRYPFAAANLLNLVPAGADCNRKYKRDDNPLFKKGIRRKVLNPYGNMTFVVSLANSVPFEGENGLEFNWQVDFNPSGTEAETWDDVYKLRQRYIRDVLTPNWTRWIDGFSRYAADHNKTDDAELLALIPRWRRILAVEGLSELAFLKVAFFDMIDQRIQHGDLALLRLIRNTAKPIISV